MRWLVDYFSIVSKAQYNYEVIIIVNEIMVPYKGCYCNIKQYMKGNP
jgi:hypothetical protein